ncbi:MAG: DUF262 domain-containing protein [Oscillospiraceae bacterium]|nr:DUF262 domain-containing protein [Oscillospiraceae bacterium]
MPKQKTKEAVPLTDAELRQKAIRRWDADVQLSPSLLKSEPTYFFKPGETVVHGNWKNTIIDELLHDGKAYLVHHVATDKKTGEETTEYAVVPWYYLRRYTPRSSVFATNDDVRLNYNNSTVESLIHRYHHFGVNMEPEYQRGYVWDDSDRERLLDSIFFNADIGKFVFNEIGWASVDHDLYEIIDGKQRLSTLVSYFENPWSYRGVYFNELSGQDRYRFMNHPIVYADLRNADCATTLKVFLMLNRGGKQMDKEHLQKIEEMYLIETCDKPKKEGVVQ